MLVSPCRFDEIQASDVTFTDLPKTATFGKGWVVAPAQSWLLQTPKLCAPYGCIRSAYHNSSDAGKAKLSLALAIPEDTEFRTWYVGLEEHLIHTVEDKCIKWFGKHSCEVQPSVRDAFYTCLKPDDLRSDLMLTLSIPTRGSEVLTNIYAADGRPVTHEAITKNQQVACHIEFDGIWFANQRWGLRWKLCSIKCYGVEPDDSGYAFIADNDDDDDEW